MKKIVTLSIVSLMSSLMMVGCGAEAPKPPVVAVASTVDSVERVVETNYSRELGQKKVHKLIANAAEADGWKVTEFKNNEILAEKTSNNDTTAVSIHFDSASFKITPPNSELAEVITKALK